MKHFDQENFDLSTRTEQLLLKSEILAECFEEVCEHTMVKIFIMHVSWLKDIVTSVSPSLKDSHSSVMREKSFGSF